MRRPLAFVDIETTGGSYTHGRVLEIGVLRVENHRVVDKFHSLLNPIGGVPQVITRLTGITTADVQGEPQFAQIAPRLTEILDGAVFIAHNVRFDYSFIKREYALIEQQFSPKLLCTVRLSRSLFPHERRHGLEAVIERHKLRVNARHRAYDDAEAIWQFYQLLLQEFDLDTIEQAVGSQLKRQALPPHLTEADIEVLPETPGVYIFEGEATDSVPLYIGKSVNIRERVLSHFYDDLKRAAEFQVSQQLRRIRTITTSGELGALLLESRLVKEQQPLYNKRLRRTHELTMASGMMHSSGYPTISFATEGDAREALALYRTKGRAKLAVLTLADEYRLCKKLLGLEKAQAACFGYQLHKCLGACIGQESVADYTARFEAAFAASRIQAWPFGRAILITERHPFVAEGSAYLVNNWCLVAQIHEDAAGLARVEEVRLPFDLDAYQILQSYLKNPKTKRFVREVDEADILAFAG